MDTSKFPAKLKELREQADLTQQQLADRAGVSKATVADLEQGRYHPSWPTVVALADALGISTETFRQEPAAREPAGPGRPPKATAETPAPARGGKGTAKGKKPGRKRKGE
jgi:putative transcriptional regulator